MRVARPYALRYVSDATYLLPQEERGERDLQRRRLNRVQVREQTLDALRVGRHQIDDLARRLRLTRRAR